jgi:8-oxo-dGTP pyrophosphatase MutT (NUDIX family)
LHQALLRFAHCSRLVWWWLRKPHLHGCRAIVTNEAGALLLVRHSYQRLGQWMLPGGGLNSGESAEEAAAREVAEETGCRISGAHCFGVNLERLAGSHHDVHLVVATSSDTPKPDGREIIDAQFFPADALPVTLSAATGACIDLWRQRTR